MSYLQELDQIAAELRQRHPGWQVWFVPGIGTVTWCARPYPLINAQTPEQLEAEIAQAHAEAAEHWPALAPEPRRRLRTLRYSSETRPAARPS
jgi:hypothetical protein